MRSIEVVDNEQPPVLGRLGNGLLGVGQEVGLGALRPHAGGYDSPGGDFQVNPLIPFGERQRRGTRVRACYPDSQQRVAESDRALVPRARELVWIGELAASTLVTTRPARAERCRSRLEDCLHPPLPRPLPLVQSAVASYGLL